MNQRRMKKKRSIEEGKGKEREIKKKERKQRRMKRKRSKDGGKGT